MGRVYDYFSIKYLIPFDVTTKDIKSDSILRAIQTVEYANEIEAIKNIGGNAPAPFMVESGQPDPSLNFEVTEIRKGMYEAFEDCTVTETSAEGSGGVGTFANTSGTSIKDAANGISTVTISATNYANLKAGRYILKKGTLATDISIYVAGLVGTFDNESGLVAEDIDCSTPGAVEVAELGITLTVVGSASFSAGDVATIEEVRPTHYGYNKIVVGSGDNPSLVGLFGVQPKQVTGDIYLFEFPKLFVPGGINFSASTREFSAQTINATPIVDTDDDSVYTIYQILGSA